MDDEGKGPVEPGAHFYRSLQLDEHGNPINKRNAWATRSVAYVRLIPPGAADTVHYRLQIPDDAGDRISLRAKVNYRKFAWWNTQWAFAGVRDPAAAELRAVTRAYDDGRWVFTRRHVEGVGRDQGDSRHPDHRDGRGAGVARASCRQDAPLPAVAAAIWTRRSASAGTTTASACCCRAISRRRRRRS